MTKTKRLNLPAILVFLCILSNFTFSYGAKIIQTGVRISKYGVGDNPFPTPRGWHNAINAMHDCFPEAERYTIWTVGENWAEDSTECRLYFPSKGGNYPNISYDDEDLSEKYFDYFDNLTTCKVKVFLQVEPGNADIKTLMDIVFKQYGHHSCVVGFGIDVEWYECHLNEWGKKVTDDVAKKWEEQLKTINSSYRLFLKHPDKENKYLPPSYRGNIIFVNDCEARAKKSDPGKFTGYKEEFLPVMKTFADHFYPNLVFFQIGYPTTKPLWQNFNNKPLTIGNDILAQCKQDIGVFWVDFGMEGILPFDDKPTAIHPVKPPKMVSQQATDVQIYSLKGQLLGQFRIPSGALTDQTLRTFLPSIASNNLLIYMASNGQRREVHPMVGSK